MVVGLDPTISRPQQQFLGGENARCDKSIVQSRKLMQAGVKFKNLVKVFCADASFPALHFITAVRGIPAFRVKSNRDSNGTCYCKSTRHRKESVFHPEQTLSGILTGAIHFTPDNLLVIFS
jgi:hypothetical protein